MGNLFADDRMEESQPFDPMEATAPGPDVPHEPDAPVRAGRRRRRRHTLITETAELTLGPFAPDGTTPADYNGRTIPVEKGIAGERTHATVLTLTGRNGWTRGSVTEVLEASANRVEAPCPYFRDHDCGGCEWQHIAYSAQLQTYKAGIVRDLLREAGIERDIDHAESLDEPWRYRHSAAIALAKGAGFRRRRRQSVIPIRDCPISHPAISDLLTTLNDWYDAGVYPDLRGQVWIEVKVVGSAETPLLQLVVGGIGGMNLPARPELHPLADALAALPNIASVCYKHPSGETHTYAGPAASIVEVGGQPYLLPAGSFFQTNLGLVPRLIERILSLIELDASHVAADIYCGAGLFTMPLASRAGRVIAIELDPAAITAAHETARLWGLTNVELFARPAEKAMDLLPDLDLALVDPPRSGLDPRVTAAITAKRPRQFIYVSCNPVTLARDLRAFTDAGYTIHWLELFDFFPQTSHVETLVYLRSE